MGYCDPVPENSSIDGHTLAFKALPYTEVTPLFKELWNKYKEPDLSEQDKSKKERLMELAQNIIYIAELDEMLDVKNATNALKSFDNNYGYQR